MEPYILATQAQQVFYLEDPSKSTSNWRVVEDIHHRKLWDHPSISVANEIDVLHDNQSSDYNLVVDDGVEVGEQGLNDMIDVYDNCDLVVDLDCMPVDPIVDDECFINDDGEDEDAYMSDDEDEINDNNDDSDDDLVNEDVYLSGDSD
ncbi:hypothetical protein QVD17_32056 [Tagetes erecta]|uniref:DUF4216 domain-containing protein n=1 Tax=Tagetes erecta TaxID=13708 RepID=A0AAD8NPC8_TARER|nr:hypothetical protein QVD17_32056 [Tagetes erecta]